jgi:hypothetical protein
MRRSEPLCLKLFEHFLSSGPGRLKVGVPLKENYYYERQDIIE